MKRAIYFHSTLGSSGCQKLTQANTSKVACFQDVPTGTKTGISGELWSNQLGRPYQDRSRTGECEVVPIPRTVLAIGLLVTPPALQNVIISSL